MTKLIHRIIKFKSEEPFFTKEFTGKKKNTIRKIDYTDKRFRTLAVMEEINQKGFIQIERVKNIRTASKIKFIRRIRDISFWEDLVIISW